MGKRGIVLFLQALTKMLLKFLVLFLVKNLNGCRRNVWNFML